MSCALGAGPTDGHDRLPHRALRIYTLAGTASTPLRKPAPRGPSRAGGGPLLPSRKDRASRRGRSVPRPPGGAPHGKRDSPPRLARAVARMLFRPPVTLMGRTVELAPLSFVYEEDLVQAGQDPEVWRFMRTGDHSSPARMHELVAETLAWQGQARDLAFVILRLPERTAVGMTRFLDIQREHRSVEIGGTWLDRRFWGTTPYNTEAKYLLLRHAFEAEGCLRVQIKTDLRNLRSQRAIERLGAVKEGVMRKHCLLPDGHVRDSVFYSILTEEWPAVRARLETFLRRPGEPPR
jgi:RimJ/RimL family protein N-acetyltransferase